MLSLRQNQRGALLQKFMFFIGPPVVLHSTLLYEFLFNYMCTLFGNFLSICRLSEAVIPNYCLFTLKNSYRCTRNIMIFLWWTIFGTDYVRNMLVILDILCCFCYFLLLCLDKLVVFSDKICTIFFLKVQ